MLDSLPNCFNLRREANPLATLMRTVSRNCSMAVSISGEKPIPWRLASLARLCIPPKCFNLRREANPLATCDGVSVAESMYPFQSQARSQSPGDEMLQWPSVRRAIVSISGEKPIPWRRLASSSSASPYLFQSQARSQSPGDVNLRRREDGDIKCFNLRREANPLATASRYSGRACISCFNLRREANPLAT